MNGGLAMEGGVLLEGTVIVRFRRHHSEKDCPVLWLRGWRAPSFSEKGLSGRCPS